MLYAYYVVSCKNPYCKQPIAVRYVGEFEEEVPIRTVPADFPESLDLQCESCSKAHTYTLGNLKVKFLPAPPTAEFRGL